MMYVRKSCITNTKTRRFGIFLDQSETTDKNVLKTENWNIPRIAIIGGGICGVTAAKAIVTRLNTIAPTQKFDIQVYEADPRSVYGESSRIALRNQKHPDSNAATSKNANSLVPGAAMHIMSQRSTLAEIAKDSIRELYLSLRSGDANSRNFSSVPPYFGFRPTRCLGWSTTWNEKLSFILFMFHFVKASLMTGEKEAKQRGRLMVQLAKANRVAFKREIDASEWRTASSCGQNMSDRIGLQAGFISVHRTLSMAEHVLQEAAEVGEFAELLSRSEAIHLEPTISRLPLENLYFVHRKDDQSANCAEFTREMLKSLEEDENIVYKNNGVASINLIKENDLNRRFRVTTSEGVMDDFDHVILAAGVFTPILAANISRNAGLSCPTYPLRGYSLTIFTEPRHNDGTNFLRKSMSYDKMYFTSVTPNMVRIAGFGEIAGFPKVGRNGPSGVGPMVLEKYAKHIFGQDAESEISHKTQSCYRPMSPDDIPLVGAVRAVPGLFLHSGHGTLGWTLSLATAHCLAQDVCDCILRIDNRDSFVLPDGSSISKNAMSPDRFRLF